MQWGPLLPKRERMIQMDIDDHPPIPLAQNMVFQLGIVSMIFGVLNFWGHFKALNVIFLAR
jgi:hypothetical protein